MWIFLIEISGIHGYNVPRDGWDYHKKHTAYTPMNRQKQGIMPRQGGCFGGHLVTRMKEFLIRITNSSP